jgi:4-hydroxy-tetrahydrodipicolinate reductase
MRRVIVAGALGRMGSECVHAVHSDAGLSLAARVDPGFASAPDEGCFPDLSEALAQVEADVLVDFTRPDVVEANIRCAFAAGLECVGGTTGLSEETLADLATALPAGCCLFYAPNFALGAVLLMQAAQRIARYMPQAEIIELHHDKKLDAPSGTALRTAQLIAAARTEPFVPAPGKESELAQGAGARGAAIEGVPVHSIRLPGLLAHQEVIFGASGQTLTLRHDSIDRSSFMPGVVLACHKTAEAEGLIVGLEQFLSDAD